MQIDHTGAVRGPTMQLEWWYWVIAGFFLMGLDLIIPSFTLIWFGLGALAVAVLKWLWPDLHFLAQLLLWPVASISFTVMWFKYLKPKASKNVGGLSGEKIIGETGSVIRGADEG